MPQSAEQFVSRPAYAEVSRKVRVAPPRYRNEIGKFSIHRSSGCIGCGRCVETCRYGVHIRPEGYRPMQRPLDYRCIGPACEETDAYCVDACPQQALSLCENPAFKTIGDCRWTADLLVSTWQMAETGHAPGPQLESEIGASGGGFDRLRFRFSKAPPEDLRREGHLDGTGAQPPR